MPFATSYAGPGEGTGLNSLHRIACKEGIKLFGLVRAIFSQVSPSRSVYVGTVLTGAPFTPVIKVRAAMAQAPIILERILF